MISSTGCCETQRLAGMGVSLAAPIASQTKALAPAIGSPIDAAFLPLLPDKAEEAIGAKRKANNDALLAILMEL